jgi:hypothetical protein
LISKVLSLHQTQGGSYLAAQDRPGPSQHDSGAAAEGDEGDEGYEVGVNPVLERHGEATLRQSARGSIRAASR